MLFASASTIVLNRQAISSKHNDGHCGLIQNAAIHKTIHSLNFGHFVAELLLQFLKKEQNIKLNQMISL